MASLWKLLLIVALFLPNLVQGYRPFDIPKTLFTPASKDAHLPFGAHVIRSAGKELLDQDEDSGADFVQDSFLRGERKRRDAPRVVPNTAYVSTFICLNREDQNSLYF